MQAQTRGAPRDRKLYQITGDHDAQHRAARQAQPFGEAPLRGFARQVVDAVAGHHRQEKGNEHEDQRSPVVEIEAEVEWAGDLEPDISWAVQHQAGHGCDRREQNEEGEVGTDSGRPDSLAVQPSRGQQAVDKERQRPGGGEGRG